MKKLTKNGDRLLNRNIMSRLASIMAMASMSATYPAMPFIDYSSPIFIPKKHTKMKYADHKRMKAKRKNKK